MFDLACERCFRVTHRSAMRWRSVFDTITAMGCLRCCRKNFSFSSDWNRLLFIFPFFMFSICLWFLTACFSSRPFQAPVAKPFPREDFLQNPFADLTENLLVGCHIPAGVQELSIHEIHPFVPMWSVGEFAVLCAPALCWSRALQFSCAGGAQGSTTGTPPHAPFPISVLLCCTVNPFNFYASAGWNCSL